VRAIREQFKADLEANLAEYHGSAARGTQPGRVAYLEKQLRAVVACLDDLLSVDEVDMKAVDAAVDEAVEERE